MLSRNRRSRSFRGVVAPIAAVAMVVSACDGSSPKASPSGGTFTLRIPAAPISLDVPKNFNLTNTTFIALVTEKLETISPNGELRPDLATSVRKPDAKTLVYTLRQGVKFSDGSILTAADVAWSIEHAATGTSQLSSLLASFASATATDPTTVTVKLKTPDALAENRLAALVYVQQAEFAQAHAKDLGTSKAMPIGTGQYVFSSSTPQGVALTRNPRYWGAKPAPDKVAVSVVADENAAQLAMRSGSIDGSFIQNLKAVGPWKAMSGVSVHSLLPNLSLDYMSLDVARAPFDDVHVRKAFAYSLDRKGILAAAYGSYASPVNGVALPGELAGLAPSEDALRSFMGSLPGYEFSLASARSELARSRHPNGFTVTVIYASELKVQELAVLNLQQNMGKLGVKIIPKPVTVNQWITDVYAHNQAVVLVTYNSSTPDPVWRLGGLTTKANMAANGFNTAQWTSPNVEKANTQLAESSDKATRWEAAQTILSAIANDVPYVPIGSPDKVFVVGNKWKFKNVPSINDMWHNGTWVSDLRAR